MSGGVVGNIISGVTSTIGGMFGAKQKAPKVKGKSAEETAQEAADKQQQITNERIARRRDKSRSVLGSAASGKSTLGE